MLITKRNETGTNCDSNMDHTEVKRPLLKFPKNNHMFSKIFVKLVSKMEVHNVPGHYSTYRLHQLSVHLFLENSDLRQDNRIIGP